MENTLTVLQRASIAASGITILVLGFMLDYSDIGRFGRTLISGVTFMLYVWSIYDLKPGRIRAASIPIQLLLGVLATCALVAARQLPLLLYALAIPAGILVSVLLNLVARRTEA